MSWLINNQDWHIGSPQSIDLWFRQPTAVHDIAITDIIPSTYKCYPGDVVGIVVIVENKGTSPEVFNVTLYYDAHLIARTQMSQVLENKTSRSIRLEWNTTSVPLGNYTIKAEISLVPDEVDVSNNEKTDGVIRIALHELVVIVVDGLGNPISSAVVEIVGQQQASTDINGETRFSLAKGLYQVRASKGTLSNSINLKLTGDTVLRISLVPLPYGPKAEFTASPETARVNEPVKFDASTSKSGFNGTHTMLIAEYQWDFGDGNKTTTATPIVYHNFHSPGIYYVTLTVYAPGAIPETNATSRRITVISIPVGGYSFPIKTPTIEKPLTPYFVLIAILTMGFTTIKRKSTRKKQ